MVVGRRAGWLVLLAGTSALGFWGKVHGKYDDWVPKDDRFNDGGFVSVEVFKFEEGAETIAAKSIEYLRRTFA